MIISILVDVNTWGSCTGIVEPESHTAYRQHQHTRDHLGHRVSGFVNGHRLDGTVMADNEENAVRLAEQMVREAFARLRRKM